MPAVLFEDDVYNDEETSDDKCKRRPVQFDKVSHYIVDSLYILKRTNRINAFEFFITYCYLFNGVSLKMLKDRVLKNSKGIYNFGSKQHIHQNILTKVINMMKNEIERIKEAERSSASFRGRHET